MTLSMTEYATVANTYVLDIDDVLLDCVNKSIQAFYPTNFTPLTMENLNEIIYALYKGDATEYTNAETKYGKIIDKYNNEADVVDVVYDTLRDFLYECDYDQEYMDTYDNQFEVW